jgi:hypothetical protein
MRMTSHVALTMLTITVASMPAAAAPPTGYVIEPLLDNETIVGTSRFSYFLDAMITEQGAVICKANRPDGVTVVVKIDEEGPVIISPVVDEYFGIAGDVLVDSGGRAYFSYWSESTSWGIAVADRNRFENIYRARNDSAGVIRLLAVNAPGVAVYEYPNAYGIAVISHPAGLSLFDFHSINEANPLRISLNAHGVIAFIKRGAPYGQPSTNDTLYVVHPDEQPLAIDAGASGGFSSPWVSINNRGDVAYSYFTPGVGTEIRVSDGTSTRTEIGFADGFVSLSLPQFNDSGRIAFGGRTTAGLSAIFVKWDDRIIAAIPQLTSLDGAPLASRWFGRFAFNNAGQLAFIAFLRDGRHFVCRVSPVFGEVEHEPTGESQAAGAHGLSPAPSIKASAHDSPLPRTMSASGVTLPPTRPRVPQERPLRAEHPHTDGGDH